MSPIMLTNRRGKGLVLCREEGMSKAVIVTGASGLLGGAIALAFGAKGWKVVAGYLGPRQSVDEVTAEINRGPGEALAMEADIRDYSQVARLVNAAVAKW